MLKTKSISADQIDVNDSLNPRVDITAQDIKASIPVNPKIEYLWYSRESRQIVRNRQDRNTNSATYRPAISRRNMITRHYHPARK